MSVSHILYVQFSLFKNFFYLKIFRLAGIVIQQIKKMSHLLNVAQG